MTFWRKTFPVFLLCIFISASLTSCKKNQSNNEIIDNISYTTVAETSKTTSEVKITYIVNVNTKKFHCPDCPSVEQMSEHNKWEYIGNRNDLISSGYKPCKKCEP